MGGLAWEAGEAGVFLRGGAGFLGIGAAVSEELEVAVVRVGG